jgi:hypothetical protein
MHRLAAAALSTAALTTGFAFPALLGAEAATAAPAAVGAHAPGMTAAVTCSIHNKTGSCPSGGEFCSKDYLHQTSVLSTGVRYTCTPVGGYNRWMRAPSTPVVSPTTGSTTSPVGGVAAGEGGMARASVPVQHGPSALPLEIGAAGAVAAGIGAVLVIRKRRSAGSER